MRLYIKFREIPCNSSWSRVVTHFKSHCLTNGQSKIFVSPILCSYDRKKQNNTSMMWPSQNFLLYNGTIIKIKVNEWIII